MFGPRCPDKIAACFVTTFGSACALLAFALPILLPTAHAAAPTPEWKDGRGATFKGEPVEALGPFAMFRTGSVASKFMPMRALSPEDCVRFYQAIASRAPRAEKWSDAKGEVSRECIGRLQRNENGQLRVFKFESVPEPELIVALFGGRRIPDTVPSQHLLDNLAPFINRVQRVYPNRVATIVWATQQAGLNLKNLPNPRLWLVADPNKQSGLKVLSRFAPAAGFMMVLMTREGIPLLGGAINSVDEVMHFVDRASDVLWQLNPANPHGARDRLYYLRAVRPLMFATSKAEPELLIDPLRVDALRQREVKRVEAQFEVGADGRVREVELLPASEIPPALTTPLLEALRINTVFLPAIENGTPLAGTFRYTLKIEAAPDPKLAADAAWVNGEARVDVPFKSWLVLKSIKVPEQVFSMVQGIGVDGTVMLAPVTAGDPNKISLASQKNAFNSDWFTATGGPASVHPMAGEKQVVDGDKYAWKKMVAEDGRVDFMDGKEHDALNYCVGYAWTEIEVPADVDAWLGIGSDDGLKVWLNGDIVIDQWVQRTGRLDDDVVAVRLKKGPNAFLIKIQNMRGIWNFTARLRVRGT